MINKKQRFIGKARKIHGEKYFYEKVEYRDSQTKVIITCPEHGGFPQTPNSHIMGKGCPKCAPKAISAAVRMTNEEFVAKAKEKHGDIFDYSAVKYEHSKKKVKIICPIHGEFEQRAAIHLIGNGCPKCGKGRK
jgi:hypothetical protein